MLMTLGLFVWSLNTLAYQELQRQTQWRHTSSSRVGQRPAYQFVGPGDDSITLSGWIAPELAGDAVSIDELRMMGDSGKPFAMVSGKGEVFGLWVIVSLSENKTLFYPDGSARRIDFNLSLKRVDDDQVDQIGLITNPQELLV